MHDLADGRAAVITPPRWRRLAYRVFDARLPAAYGPWVAADITSPGWERRRARVGAVFLLVVVAGMTLNLLVSARRWWWLVGYLVAMWIVVGVSLLRAHFAGDDPAARRRALARHRLLPDGTSDPCPPHLGVAEPLTSRQRTILVGMVAAAVIGTGGYVGWYEYQHHLEHGCRTPPAQLVKEIRNLPPEQNGITVTDVRAYRSGAYLVLRADRVFEFNGHPAPTSFGWFLSREGHPADVIPLFRSATNSDLGATNRAAGVAFVEGFEHIARCPAVS